MFDGFCASRMADTFAGSGDIPDLLNTKPKNVIWSRLNSHLERLSFRPLSFNALKVFSRALSCSSCVLPNTKISFEIFLSRSTDYDALHSSLKYF